MDIERYRVLAAVIAAHPNGQVVGRTRLQKTIKILQSLGLPTDYNYMLHFYGPYSEGVQAEIGLLERCGLIEETKHTTLDGNPYYIMKPRPGAENKEINEKYGHLISQMSEADVDVLELAATYDAFRESGLTHEKALVATQKKKAVKCVGTNLEQALELLKKLGLPTT